MYKVEMYRSSNVYDKVYANSHKYKGQFVVFYKNGDFVEAINSQEIKSFRYVEE